MHLLLLIVLIEKILGNLECGPKDINFYKDETIDLICTLKISNTEQFNFVWEIQQDNNFIPLNNKDFVKIIPASTSNENNQKILTYKLELAAKIGTAGNYKLTLTSTTTSSTTFSYIFNVKYISKNAEKYVAKYSAIVGSNLNYICPINSAPISKPIEWYLNGKKINADKRITFSDDNYVKNLKININDFDINDAGKYECVYTVNNDPIQSSFILVAKDFTSHLWPLIGIILNVILVAVLILAPTYFKNRRMVRSILYNPENPD